MFVPRMATLVSELRANSCVVAEVRPSPNHGERKGVVAPNMIVLHYTGMSDNEAALKLLASPASEVSAHYVVLQDGYIIQMVAEDRRAWHAGAAYWAGETDINSARSASRSPIRATTTAIRIFRGGRSRR